MRRTLKSKFLLSTIMGGAVASMGLTAMAQDVVDDDEVVVTGSRLNVNPNLTAAQPILTVSAEEIAITGAVNIEELTNNLPQVVAAQSSEVFNGATGTASLDLRALGAQRTLTLIDGRRLPYGDSASIAVNLDLVPTNLVERIEVLTGGSSAVYGSDAVAGVANFVLKDDFEGVELDIQYGTSQSSNGRDFFDQVLRAASQPVPDSSWDGEEITGSVTLGTNTSDGRGNVTVYASYQNREDISQADRSASGCALGAGTGPLSANGFQCAGSANFRLFGGANGFFFQQEGGQIDGFNGGPAETFNFGPFNFFQRPSERFQLYGKGTYEIAEGHELFADIGYTEVTSNAQIAPTASFGIRAYQLNCDNPFIQTPVFANGDSFATGVLGCTAAQIANGDILQNVTASHRNVEGGPRNTSRQNSGFRMVTGLRGTVADNWDYEIFGQYSASRDVDSSTNDFIISNLQQAFLVRNDANGNPVCIDPSSGCVPYNIFQRGPNGETLVTQDALDFVQGIGISTGETDQLVIGGNVQTSLTEYGVVSPWAPDTNVGLLFGMEYRQDGLKRVPDQISQQPDGGFTGVGGPTLPVAGNLDVLEVYGEIEIPIVTQAPFFEELVFNGQYRYSDYSVDGNGVTNDFSTDTYGLQLTWVPVPDISFRGQYQRAVRAPNVIELFTGQGTGLPNLTQGPNGLFDPCAGPTPSASAAACANTGVTAAQYGSILDVISGQTQSITGGNPNLNPEESDTYTIGAVLTPSFLPGFNASVDYFDIAIDNAIVAGIGAQNILDNCIASGDPVFCDLLQRDGSGSLNAGSPGVGFTLTQVNIASLERRGFDFQANYSFDLDALGGGDLGEFGLQYASTILTGDDFISFPGSPVVECEGEFAGQCGRPRSSYRHRMLASWMTPIEGLQANVIWRHFGGVDNDSATAAAVDQSLPSRDYIDLSGSWEFMDGVTGRFGVNNVFETKYPVSVSAGPNNFGNGNTWPGIYDTGRFMFVGLNLKL
ncbi:MAG: TonB-dependent receptor [Pseudomonadota bacterium]